jgi:hypothetical protein
VKKLFLSSSSGYKWDQIKTWNLSAKKTGHDVCNLLINPSQELVDSCNEYRVSAVGYNLQQMNKPPHNLRFLLQYKYLMSVKDIYSHVVLTDSRDVYFHSDPFPRLIELLGSRNIICGSECIAYQDEHWGNGNLKEGFGYVYDEYKTQEICNVGVLCGTVEAVAELCLMIFTMCYHNPASVSDQSSFNILMGTEFGRKTIQQVRPSDGLMVHLGTVGVQKFRDKLIEKPTWDDTGLPIVNGTAIPIIHQYDRVDTSKWGAEL